MHQETTGVAPERAKGLHLKSTNISKKEPYISTLEPHLSAQEPYKHKQELYLSATEPSLEVPNDYHTPF